MKRRIYIFGTGAHARKVALYAMQTGWHVEGFVDEAVHVESPVAGLPVLDAEQLPSPSPDASLFVAIGAAGVRRRLMDRCALKGWLLPSLVHASAYVAQDAHLGEGVLVAAGAVVETGCIVERGAIVDIGTLIDHDSRIGAFVHLRAGTICPPRTLVPQVEVC